MTPKEIGWLAGLLEGEGSFEIKHNSKNLRLTTELGMTDKDIVERAFNLTKMGNVYEYKSKRVHEKIVHRWMITKQIDAASLMMTVYPLMGERRQAKIRECLRIWKSYLYSWQLPCPKDHSLDQMKLNNNGHRFCLQCREEYNEKRRFDKLLGY